MQKIAQNQHSFSKNWDFSISPEFRKLIKKSGADKVAISEKRAFLEMSLNKGFIIVSNAKIGYSKKEYFNGVRKN